MAPITKCIKKRNLNREKRHKKALLLSNKKQAIL
jgi:hypothetical protein